MVLVQPAILLVVLW